MEITKFAGKTCVKCRVLDNILKQVDLPCEVNTVYMEDEEEQFEKNGVVTVPTLLIKNGDKEVKLEGMSVPDMIKDAISKVL
jgi:predicted DsbA family dithiol-disulfide isomerase